ncbi:MAG: DUF308 domain-containing protein [Bacilli bacterium]
MKKISVINYSNESSLLSAILFLIFGMVLFTNPGGIVKFISYIAGGVLFVIGLSNLLSYYKTLKKLNIKETSKLISGIILIVLGLISILFASIIETTLRLIIGGWIIYSGIIRLIETINGEKDKTYLIVRLIIAILMIICGFYVVLKTNLVFSMIGLFIIIYSVMEIIGYIFSKLHDKKSR